MHVVPDRSEFLSSLAVDALAAAGQIRLRAVGGSMLPAMRPGDLLSVRTQPRETIARGDVILFRRHGRLLAHRVVGRAPGLSPPAFIVQGDGLSHPDPPVPQADLLGRVVLVTRRGKTFQPARRLSAAGRLLAWFVRRVGCGAGVLLRGYALWDRAGKGTWWKKPA